MTFLLQLAALGAIVGISGLGLTAGAAYKKLFLDCASLVAQRLKRLPGMQETRVQSLGRSKASFSLWNIRFQLKLDCASLTSLSDISFKDNPLSDGSGQLKASANV